MQKNRSVGIMISYASIIVNMISGLVLSAFLLRALGDVEYGLYQSVSAFAGYLILLEFGTGTVMARNISVCLNAENEADREELLNRNYSTIWVISLILSCAMILVGGVFYLTLDKIYAVTMTPAQIAYAREIILLLIGFILAGYLTQNISGFLLAQQEYVFSKLLALIRVVIRTVLLIVVISISRYAIHIASIDLLLNLAVLLISLCYCRREYRVKFSLRCFDHTIFRASIPMCVALLLQALTNQANSNVDKFLISIMMSMENVALYSIVQYIFTMFSSVATVPVSMFLPEITRTMAGHPNGQELTRSLVHPCRLTVIFCGSLLFGFIAVGRQFISVFYGADKVDAWIYTLIILVPAFVNLTDSVVISVMDVANKRLARSLVLLGSTAVNIILTIILMRYWDIYGAVIATAFAMVVGEIIILNLYYQKVLHIKVLLLFREAYRGILPYQILTCAVVFFLAGQIEKPLASMLVGGVVYLVVSFGLIWFFGLNESEAARVRVWMKKLRLAGGKEQT